MHMGVAKQLSCCGDQTADKKQFKGGRIRFNPENRGYELSWQEKCGSVRQRKGIP